MILVAIGSNLPYAPVGAPIEVCAAALAALEAHGVAVEARSRWYASAPVPASAQPDFVNGVAAVATDSPPGALLATLHAIEAAFGRARPAPGAARTLDLDLIAYHDVVRTAGAPPLLPHPRMAERAFVLFPLGDVAPGWRHPADARSLADLVAALPPGQTCRPCG